MKTFNMLAGRSEITGLPVLQLLIETKENEKNKLKNFVILMNTKKICICDSIIFNFAFIVKVELMLNIGFLRMTKKVNGVMKKYWS